MRDGPSPKKKVQKEESKAVPKKVSNKKATPENEAATAKKTVAPSPVSKNKRTEKVESKKKAQEDVQAVGGEDTTSEE